MLIALSTILLLSSPSRSNHQPTHVFENSAGNTWVTIYHWDLKPVFIWPRDSENKPLHQAVNVRRQSHYQAMFPNMAGKSFTVSILYTNGLRRTITHHPAKPLSDTFNKPKVTMRWGWIKRHHTPTRKDAAPIYPP